MEEAYLVYGMQRDHNDENLRRVLIFPQNAVISMWTLFVRHDSNIQVHARQSGSENEFN